jgi:hypothetical protein
MEIAEVDGNHIFQVTQVSHVYVLDERHFTHPVYDTMYNKNMQNITHARFLCYMY